MTVEKKIERALWEITSRVRKNDVHFVLRNNLAVILYNKKEKTKNIDTPYHCKNKERN